MYGYGILEKYLFILIFDIIISSHRPLGDTQRARYDPWTLRCQVLCTLKARRHHIKSGRRAKKL